MTMDAHSKLVVDQFFAAIEPIRSAYLDPSFTYLAIRRRESFALVTGRVTFNNAPTKIPLTHFQSANIRAGHYSLKELGTDPRKFIEAIISGKIPTPAGEILFPAEPSSHHSAYYQPFHQQGLQNQNRIDVLGILGATNDEINRMVHHDWEVRAATEPYDGVQELIGEYQTGLPRTDRIAIEFVAPNVAIFDLSSGISGTKANLIVRVSTKADTDLFTLGYRVLSQGRVHSRGTIPGSSFKWADTADYRQGTTELKVPNAAVIQCIARYADIAEHQGWAADPNTVQNPKRAVYETFDKNLEFLNEVIAREGRVRARDLEVVIGWLLWMLGFGAANLGGTDRTQDAADLLVTTPYGHIAVVEVTTGLLKAENKLSILHERAQAVRRSLDTSNNRHIRILPIIVTSKTRDEIQPDLEQAEKWGILVLTRENLHSAVNSTLVLPNAEQMYEDAERTVRDARAKHEAKSESEPNLPLIGGAS